MGTIITWIVIGGLAGWIASKIMGTDAEQSVLGNIVVGIIGALVGGFVVGLLGGEGFNGFNIWSFIVALIGAIIVTWIYNKMRGRNSHSKV